MAASFAQILGNKRIALMLPLGFASGLPLALTSGTLQAWLTVAGVDLKTIGIFTLVGLPYSLKFLWAPVITADGAKWDARAEFTGPMPPPALLTPWEQYAQVLLLANEFAFVD